MQILQELNKAITGKKIIIYDLGDSNLLASLKEKISMFTDSIVIWSCTAPDKMSDIVRCISPDDFEQINSIYRLYEFTDRIIYISADMNYPSMFNYVNTGIMSENEMLDALLYNL